MAGNFNLADALKIQSKQQRLWHPDPKRMTDDQRREVMDELLLGLNEEVAELARETRSKPHVARAPSPRSNRLEEWTDCLKYLLAIADLEGFDSAMLAMHFLSKTAAVEQRAKQKELDLSGQRVFVTDLDACVADLTPFLDATGGMYGAPTAGTPETEVLKAKWYDTGGFLGLPVIRGAKEALLEAKSQGCLVAIITARPVWEHFRVRADTVDWLNRNGIPHDILLFNKDKWDALHQSVYPAHIVAFVEDRIKHVMELHAHRVEPIYLMDAPWNEDFNPPANIRRAFEWSEVTYWVKHETDWGRAGPRSTT